MKTRALSLLSLAAAAVLAPGCRSRGPELVSAEVAPPPAALYLDVHHLGPGEVTVEAVREAHAADLAVQDEHGVRYERYWVDPGSGTIWCLVRAPSAAHATRVHREAHGLVADEMHAVLPGILPARASGERPLFLDTHEAGPGTAAEDVAAAHRADLEVQGRHGVRFLEYWVDETSGRIHCLAEAGRAEDVVEAHREAHGLLPTEVRPVVAGE